MDSGNREPESIVNLLNGDVKGRIYPARFFIRPGVVTLLPLFANAPVVARIAVVGDWLRHAYRAAVKAIKARRAVGLPRLDLATSARLWDRMHSFMNMSPLLWVNAWMAGMTTSMILFASHLHQREGDEVSGKLSPCVDGVTCVA